jgi:8-oxo-dGTP pyrophosphatase MutT (NUDIX family)
MIRVYIADTPVSFVSDQEPIPHQNGVMYTSFDSKETLSMFLEPLEKHYGIKHLVIHHSDPESAFHKFSKLFKIIEAAGGVVYAPDGNRLLIFRNGKWDLPKGKIEKGEETKAAALREVEEECGLGELKIGNELPSTYHTYIQGEERILKKTHWFEMRVKEASSLSPQLEEGITEAKWLNAAQVKKALENTYPSIHDILEGVQIAV